MPDGILHDAGTLAKQAVQGLVDEARSKGETGWGVFGVELFVLTDGTLLFNEVSPRPHDTGMVTLISQRLSEFALHARAILGIPISETDVRVNLPEGCTAASRAIVVTGQGQAVFSNLPDALSIEGSDLRIFNKPEVHGHRRMAVALTIGKDESEARAKSARMLEALSISTTGESASDAR
jgi:phosphoribosylglycinamide formyltransferase 2